ncbi:sulfite exporter TauE/SafE family protein [Gammaproteobacteria bacterium]|nr:sulfite exporter TauE/SafE family protein [Gammaproteobacteria bacterium]
MVELTATIGALELLLIWSVVIFASILRSFTGFGFALTAVPVFSLFLTPLESVVLSAALTLTSNLIGVRSYWGIVPLKPMLPLVFMAVIGTAIGTMILAVISPTQFQFWGRYIGNNCFCGTDIFQAYDTPG